MVITGSSVFFSTSPYCLICKCLALNGNGFVEPVQNVKCWLSPTSPNPSGNVALKKKTTISPQKREYLTQYSVLIFIFHICVKFCTQKKGWSSCISHLYYLVTWLYTSAFLPPCSSNSCNYSVPTQLILLSYMILNVHFVWHFDLLH